MASTCRSHIVEARRNLCRAAFVRLILSTCFCGGYLLAQEPSIESIDHGHTSITREMLLSVPMNDGYGQVQRLKARVCLPPGDAPARLVVINHGSPANAADRPKMQLGRCEQEASQWFLSRGYAVAFALRRGYGETGGRWAEDNGGCSNPDYFAAGLETARDIDAVVGVITTLPRVLPDNVIVVGQSAGGWGSIAYDSIAHPKVGAFVVMAGGRGGHRHNRPNENCRPELLADAAKRFGATASTPMLWIYTANDSYFAPPIACAMWRAFTAAGAAATLEQPPAYGDDGHRLFFGPGGSSIWGPLVEQYLGDRNSDRNLPRQKACIGKE
jgi:pimeloyl-ACP methyl ester carboxylesterase